MKSRKILSPDFCLLRFSIASRWPGIYHIVMKLFYGKSNIAITALISMLCAIFGGFGASCMMAMYQKNRLIVLFDWKTSATVNQATILGLCAGLVAGYLWCRYMYHRTARYLELRNPCLITLLGEGIVMSLTLGWIFCAVVLLEISVNAAVQLDAREFSTFLPLCMSLSIVSALIAGGILSEAWWIGVSHYIKKRGSTV